MTQKISLLALKRLRLKFTIVTLFLLYTYTIKANYYSQLRTLFELSNYNQVNTGKLVETYLFESISPWNIFANAELGIDTIILKERGNINKPNVISSTDKKLNKHLKYMKIIDNQFDKTHFTRNHSIMGNIPKNEKSAKRVNKKVNQLDTFSYKRKAPIDQRKVIPLFLRNNIGYNTKFGNSGLLASVIKDHRLITVQNPRPVQSIIKFVLSQQLKQQKVVGKLTRFEVKKEFLNEFKKALSDYVKNSLSKDENIMSEAYYEKEKPSIVWLIERWENMNELGDSNNDSQAKKIMNSLFKTALTQPIKTIYIKDLEPISKEEWRRPSKKEDQQLTVILFVDAKSGTEQTFKDIYHVAMPEFRSEPGVVTYQLSQFENDPTQFVTYEKFRGDDAFQYHLKFPPIRPVIDYLNKSIKKQPFQIGLHNLIEFAPLNRE